MNAGKKFLQTQPLRTWALSFFKIAIQPKQGAF
jgi:hypothetical protein